MREPLSSLLESCTGSIKQETLTLTNEVPFKDKFVQIMERVQTDSMITKDLVLELMQLFYKNNQFFLELFETSFLLIFKTYGNEGARFNRYESQSIIEKYSQLLRLFLIEMIKMELQVQKSTQEEQYFENFVDFYLTFFAQGLTSSKSFIKEFSFKILRVSFKIIDDVLDVELLPETEGQVVESCVYLLRSGFDDYKMMGVELYGILRRIKIVSMEVEEFLFKIIESASNYELRKAAILQGLSLSTSQKVDRLLNRLRDKNPLIKQTVMQKLINEKILFQELKHEQKMKIFIDGVGSHHVHVRYKAIQFVGVTLVRFLNQNKVMEQKESEIQVSGIERFLRLFNSDHYSMEDQTFFRKNQPTSSFLLQSVSIICLNIPPELLKAQIKAIIQKIPDLTITHKESAFIHYFLRQISSAQRQNQEIKDVKTNKLELRKFITMSDFLPSFPLTVSKIRKTLRQKESWEQMEKFANILKTFQLLIKKFDVTDCAGKRQFFEQVRKFILEFEYVDKVYEDGGERFVEQSGNMHVLEFELRKLNELLSRNNNQKNKILPVITHPLDLVSLSVGIFLNLSQQNSLNDSKMQLKMHLTQLLNSKQLELEHEITTKMLMNTYIEIQKSQKVEQEGKAIQHLLEIKCELEKRLLGNKLKSQTNTIKAFTILARMLSYQQNHHHVLIKASQYIEHIKRYLYHHEDESNTNKHHRTLCYNYLAYVLIYYYCKESEQNYKSFKKLFQYYALEQDESVLRSNIKSMLTKLINLRLLTQLELFCENDLAGNSNQSLALLVEKLISMMIIFDKQSQEGSQLQNVFYTEILIRILNNSMTFVRNGKLFTMLILISLSQNQIQNSSLWIRLILIALQKQSRSHQTLIFQSLLISYQCLIMYFYQNAQDPTTKSKINTFMTETSQIFLNFFKVTTNHSTEHCSQQNQHTKILFWRLIKMMKMFQILLEKSQSFQIISIFRLKTIFPYLYELFNNKQFHPNCISIQQLVFTKNKLQKLLGLFKTKCQLQNIQKSKFYLSFLSDIDQLNDKVEDEISKRLGEKSNLFDHQQSTNHSPNYDHKTHQVLQQRIDFVMIQTFEENFNKQFKQQLLKIKIIIDHIGKTHLFQKILQIWEQSYLQRPKNVVNQQIFEADKIELHQSQVIDEKPHSVTQNISELFDRRGRRKNKTLQKRMNIEFFEVKASVKRNRYLIIPYEVVQKAESSSKKMKNYQNALKRKKNIVEKIDLFAISSKN